MFFAPFLSVSCLPHAVLVNFFVAFQEILSFFVTSIERVAATTAAKHSFARWAFFNREPPPSLSWFHLELPFRGRGIAGQAFEAFWKTLPAYLPTDMLPRRELSPEPLSNLMPVDGCIFLVDFDAIAVFLSIRDHVDKGHTKYDEPSNSRLYI